MGFVLLGTSGNACFDHGRIRAGGIFGLLSAAAVIGGGIHLDRSRIEPDPERRQNKSIKTAWIVAAVAGLIALLSMFVLGAVSGDVCAD